MWLPNSWLGCLFTFYMRLVLSFHGEWKSRMRRKWSKIKKTEVFANLTCICMERISSNMTLALKFFIPVFWAVFFGVVTIASLAYQFDFVGDIPALTFRIVMVVFYLTGLGFLYWAFVRLKRVEISMEGVYVTNYFKHFRYPILDIDRIETNDFLLFKSKTMHLKAAGSLGQKITFVPSRSKYKKFFAAHPELSEYLHREIEE